jgi:hypothetical protein
MSTQAPFLEVRSFVPEEREAAEAFESSAAPTTPFLSLYGSEEGSRLADPRAEAYALFLNDLYDEEFEETLYALASEAASLYETRFVHENADPRANGYEAERLLDQHFAPLVAETQSMLARAARELGQRDASKLTAYEVDSVVDRYQPSTEFSPNFEDFFNKIKKAVKKVASVATKLGLGPVLNKLQPLIKPLLKRVIQTAIGKLPPALQPIARKLAEQLPLLKEVEETQADQPHHAETCEVAQIQLEFNRHVANLVFAQDQTEQDLEVAEALTEQQAPDVYPVAELDRAREQFVESLGRLQDGEDPGPHVQQFIPAILPALKIGINLVGRKRVVDFLAKLLAKLIQKFVGPQYAMPLSQAIVDAGLRLIQLEARPEDEARAAASAVAATVEETVRRVAALPEYVLDNQELLEGFALEAFEQAAAANLPQVLPEETYRKRPELAEGRKLRGTWVMMPRGRRKRYKKYSRKIPVKVVPHDAAAVESFEGVPLSEFLEEALGVSPGEEVEALVHLYETLPGGHLSDIARMEQHTPGLGDAEAYEQLHPLTRDAAAMLLGEADLGRNGEAPALSDPHAAAAGQRLYYLEVPGRRLLTTPAAPGKAQTRRTTQVRLILDFQKNEIRINFFLSEIRAQEVAVKLRQHAHVGALAARLRRFIERGLRSALSGSSARLKIVHEAVTPDQWVSALRRLPSFVHNILLGRLQEWALKSLADQLKQAAQPFIKAAEDTADGVTVVITISNPPGFPEIRKLLKGQGLSLGSLKIPSGNPKVSIGFTAGYAHD